MSESVVEKFKPLFEPKAIAVIGASTRGDALPNVLIRRLRQHGYAGAIYPIHPAAKEIEDLPAYRNLADTPQPVDYAYIAIAAAQVPPLLREARGRVRYAQVISSGFGEVDEGRALQEELVAAARAGGMRLLGPNCMGLYSPRGRVTFADVPSLESGRVGKAWFDAFWQEPYSGPLLKFDQVLLTPHACTYTRRCRLSMESEAVENILRDLDLKR